MTTDREAPTPAQDQLRRPRRAALACGIALAVLLAASAIYVTHAPLAKGVIAPGQVVVLSNRKPVQHQEGGAVIAVEISEGEKVARGQILLRLDDLQASSLFEQLLKERDGHLARAAMLRAQLQHKRFCEHHPDLLARRDQPRVARLIADYDLALASSFRQLDGQAQIHRQNVAALRNRINGLRQQRNAIFEEQALLQEQLDKQEFLLQKKLADENLHASLQRELVRLHSRIAETDAAIVAADDQILVEQRLELQIAAELESGASSELAALQAALDQVDDQIAIQRDIRKRTVVRSPYDGLVFNLQVHAVGAIIAPGQPLMEIVPGDQLVVETRVNPPDIDNVRLGQKGRIRFSAFRQGTTPEIDGTVIELSADALLPEGQTPFFLVRVAPDDGQLDRLGDLAVVPGMPAEVLFQGDERTAFDYFSGVFADFWWNAMTEE